ncbi:TIR domain-containing protein [Pseudomonadota bacterium]
MDRYSEHLEIPDDAPSAMGGVDRHRPPQRSFASRLFGYDVFLSFALGPPPRGTHSYASDLARRLRERDFTVFFSEDEAAPGEQLDSALRNALLHSKVLIVIANLSMLIEPRWVRKEVEEFRQRHPSRPIVTITIGEALQDSTVAKSAQEWLGYQDKIWLAESEEAVTDGIVTEALIDRLVTAPKKAKSNVKWRWMVRVVTVMLTALAIGLGVATKVANDQRERTINSIGHIFSERAWQHLDRGERFLAAKYALAGWRIAPSTEADHRLVLASILQEANETSAVMTHLARPVTTAFSPNGDLIVTTCEDGQVRLWDSWSGKKVRVFSEHELKTTSAVFSPDGKTVASASADGTVRLWDPISGRETRPFLEHSLPIREVFFSFDGDQVITISQLQSVSLEAQELSLWNTNGGGAIWTVAPKNSVLTASFTPDGRGVVTVDASGIAQFWDRLSGQQYDHRLVGDGRYVTTAGLNLAHNIIALGYDDGAGKAFRFSTGAPLADFHGHKGAILDIKIAQSGDRVVTGGSDGSTRIWDAYSGRSIGMLAGHQREVVNVAFNVNGKRITTASSDNTVRVWTAGRMAAQLGHDGEVALAFSQDRSRMAVASAVKLELFDVPMFRTISQLALPVSTADGRASKAVSFTRDLGRILTADNNGEITSREVESGSSALVHRSTKQPLAFTLASGAPLAAIVSFDSPTNVQLLNTVNAQPVTLLGPAESPIRALSFSRDGSRLAVASQKSGLIVWNTTSRQPIMTIHERPSLSDHMFIDFLRRGITEVTLSDNGEFVAASLNDGTARVISVDLKKETSVLKPLPDLVVSLAFSPDSSLIITGGVGGARIWDVRTGRLLTSLSKPTANVAFTPDSRYVVMGGGVISKSTGPESESRTTEAWDVARLLQPMQELAAATCANFLGQDMHHFNEIEQIADPLISEFWITGNDNKRSVCK